MLSFPCVDGVAGYKDRELRDERSRFELVNVNCAADVACIWPNDFLRGRELRQVSVEDIVLRGIQAPC